MKKIIVLMFVMLVFVGCSNSNQNDRLSGSGDTKTVATATPPSLQNIQVTQTSVLPPYGVHVRADVATLKIQVNAATDDTANRLQAIHQAVEQISAQADNQATVNLHAISVSRVNQQSSDRGSVESYISKSYNSSSVILELTTPLAETDNLLTSLMTFNEFLTTLNLSETITIDTLSIAAEISNPEIYRQQLITKVYQELDSIQEAHDQSVKFEITGLHDGLQTMPVTDIEHYLYINPAIVVNEF